MVADRLAAIRRKLEADGIQLRDRVLQILIGARNIVRSHGSYNIIDHLERLDGVTILFRTLALLFTVYPLAIS
jgi:hypothetical protein